ncbi:hypothetical protein GCM10027035_49530 [Emticicia sediminis]
MKNNKIFRKTMKTLILLFLTFIISFTSLAQSTIIQPDVFKLHLNTNPCTNTDYIGSIYYNTNANLLAFCRGVNSSNFTAEHWIGSIDIYRNSNVGIRKGSPFYELDITGNNQATNFYVGDKIGIGTTTPTEKVELVDREFAITSTADAKSWRHRYSDASDRLEITENGITRILIYNGGNVGIGSYSFTPKLYANGAVNYNGNLREGGFGTMASTETTVQQMATTTMSVSNLNIPANSCATWGFTKPTLAFFTNTPAAFIGNKISGNAVTDNHLTMTVENVSTSGGTVRFCNNAGTSASLTNMVYSIIMIGD